jgi:hypothetical protein
MKLIMVDNPIIVLHIKTTDDIVDIALRLSLV